MEAWGADLLEDGCSVDEFLSAVYANMPRNWRKGQAAFNGLTGIRPDLAEKIRGTILDPFYRDDRLPTFESYLREVWN